MVELKFNLGGGTAVYKSAGAGLSILTCRPVNAAERELAVEQEEALMESKVNRMLEEAFKVSSSDPRHPPTTFHELRLLIATYASLLSVLFGTTCDHFQKVWNLYGIMKDPDVEEKRLDFSAMLCRQIVWAILDDIRGYFNKRLHPDKFRLPKDQIPFPASLLEAIYPNVRWQEPIHRNIPPQWMTQGLAQDMRRGEGLPGQRMGYSDIPPGLAAWPYPQVQVPAWGGSFLYQQHTGVPPPSPAPPGPPPRFQVPPQNTGDKLAHVHPVLRRHLDEYHRTFNGNMMFGKILQAANVRWEDLPTLPDFVDTKCRNMICFNHICGRCIFRPCRLRKGHIPLEKISTDWAEAVWKTIETGIRYNLRAAAPGSDSGSPQKKQRM